ncbi:sensor histidine kinase [Dictyobacter alpinus]|uniref:Sensor histidine kinase n=1 Tax=Dictyobacter alpinus TaxID=2014873 RepID=A0A402BF51_9CHLR|nr:sensor histidine kinase [Dictyobacter alpinus]GCE30013.1 sensor histidine kinase [Dictyobacter alpinus]
MLSLRKNSVILFRTQISLLFFPLIILPLCIVGFVSYKSSYTAIEARSASNVDNISVLANQNLDSLMQQMSQLSLTMLYQPEVLHTATYYANHPDKRSASVQDEDTMHTFFVNISSFNTNIVSADLYSTGNVWFSSNYAYAPFPDWQHLHWFKQLTHASAQTMIMPVHTLQYLADSSNANAPSVFSIAQTVIDSDTLQPIGVLVINVDAHAIIQTIANSQGKTDTKFIIYDKDKALNYPFQPDSTSSVKNIRLIQNAVQGQQRHISLNSVDYFLSNNTSLYSQWTVVALVPVTSLTQDIEVIQWTTIIAICVTLCMATGVFWFLINKIGLHVSQLRNLMRQVEHGNLDVRFHFKGNSEIVTLGQSFNHMVSRLKQSIQDNLEAQLQRERAELAALRRQINPHFLYNTLASFQMIAITEGCERVARMSFTLGQLMSYALNSEELVSLEQELEHVRSFLALMKEEYEDRLQFEIHIAGELQDCIVPKFTLQPLVENAIYHGIDPKVEAGFICIRVSQQHELLLFEIEDDGVGITEEKLVQIQEALRYDENILKRSRHIGILNIQAQLQRIFGRTYGLSIESHAGEGTRVLMKVPLSRKQQVQDSI